MTIVGGPLLRNYSPISSSIADAGPKVWILPGADRRVTPIHANRVQGIQRSAEARPEGGIVALDA